MKKATFATGLVSALFLGLSFSATAAESEAKMDSTSTIDANEVTGSKQSQEDIDKEITNARLRAESGSKSPLSMSFGLGYDGGSIKKPLSENRPDIYGNPETETQTSFGGSVDGRLRLSENDSLTLGGGVSMLTPLNSGRKSNIDNPALGYTRAYKIGSFQTISSAGVTYGTSESYKQVNLDAVASVSHNMMSQIGNSRFTAGASVSFAQYLYGGGAIADELRKIGYTKGMRTNYEFGLYPQLEYKINDTFSARTVFGYFNFQNLKGQESGEINRAYEYQSIGLGTSVTRDIYLYPNIQFLPDDLGVEKTNVALSATINLF